MLKDDDLETRAQRYVNSFSKKFEEQKSYFRSEEFNQLLGIIQKYNIIDQNDLLYENTVIDGLSAEQFGKVCNTVYQQLKSDMVKDGVDSYFPSFYIDYEEIRFHLLIGQGSTYWTTKPE